MTTAARSRDGRGRALVEGEFLFTTEDFTAIARMLYDDAGIALSESKASLVYSRLAKRLRTLGIESFQDYCRLVAGSEGVSERQNMLAALTTNVTRFFREPHHFDHLKTKVLPELVARARARGRVRIWSAGCSTGEEPYSIAMTLAESADLSGWDARILATDIDTSVVARAEAGVYAADRVQGMDPKRVKRWFEDGSGEHAGRLRVVRPLRERIAFRPLNLLGPWPLRGPFDVIFCRNVVIYFDKETQRKLFARYADILAPHGYLYIGHSETLFKISDRFRPVGGTIYRKT